MSTAPRMCSEVSDQSPNSSAMSLGVVPGSSSAVDGEEGLSIERVKNVRRKLLAAAPDHDCSREANRIHVASAEQVNELVRNDAQPLKPLGPGMVHEDPAASDLDPEWRVRVPGWHHRKERFRQPDVLVGWRRGL